jgi:hypothetical protein
VDSEKEKLWRNIDMKRLGTILVLAMVSTPAFANLARGDLDRYPWGSPDNFPGGVTTAGVASAGKIGMQPAVGDALPSSGLKSRGSPMFANSVRTGQTFRVYQGFARGDPDVYPDN